LYHSITWFSDNVNYTNKLQGYIDSAQADYLILGLGYELYELFIDELPIPTSQRFIDLLNGVKYTSTKDGKLKKWTGLANSELQSFLAYFAAYHYSYNSQGRESGNGMIQTLHENGERISPAEFQVKAYRLGIKHYNEMLDFLISNSDDYPELDYKIIQPINWAGIWTGQRTYLS